MHEATLKLRESKLGPDHPDTLSSRNNLAAAYLDAGRTAEAIKMHEATLKLRESKLGPDHPNTLTSRNNLAAAYLAAGRTAEAIKLHEATLKLCESKLGPDHPNTLISRNNLAAAYLDRRPHRRGHRDARGDAQASGVEARPRPSRHAHAAATTSPPPTSPLGRWADAEALRRDALARRRKAEKPDSPLLAGDLARLGSNLLKQAKWSEAEPLLRECLAIREKAVPDDWSRFNTMSLLGGVLLGQGRYAEAEPLVVAGYEGMKAREAKIPARRKPRLAEAAGGWSGFTRRGASPSRPPRGSRSSAWPTCPPTCSPRPEPTWRRPPRLRPVPETLREGDGPPLGVRWSVPTGPSWPTQARPDWPPAAHISPNRSGPAVRTRPGPITVAGRESPPTGPRSVATGEKWPRTWHSPPTFVESLMARRDGDGSRELRPSSFKKAVRHEEILSHWRSCRSFARRPRRRTSSPW